MITSDLVDRACSEVNGYPDDRMMTEFDVFFKEQPSICDFITELTSESSLPSESVGRIRTLNGEFQFDVVEKALCNFFRPQATERIGEELFIVPEGFRRRIQRHEANEVLFSNLVDSPGERIPWRAQYGSLLMCAAAGRRGGARVGRPRHSRIFRVFSGG